MDDAWSRRAQRYPEAREGFELIFDLLRQIDAGDEIIFFADEAGSWQVHVHWREVLPAWLKCVSATVGPTEYATLVRAVIGEFAGHQQKENEFLAEARKIATPQQAQALG